MFHRSSHLFEHNSKVGASSHRTHGLFDLQLLARRSVRLPGLLLANGADMLRAQANCSEGWVLGRRDAHHLVPLLPEATQGHEAEGTPEARRHDVVEQRIDAAVGVKKQPWNQKEDVVVSK